MVTSKAIFQPEIPDREIDREAKKVEKKLDEIDETVAPSIDTREMQRDIDKLDGPELGGGGGFDAPSRPGGGGGGRLLGGAGAGAAMRGGGGSLLSSGGAAAATSAAIPVALAGAGLFAIKGIHDSLAKASPALQQMDAMFAAAIQNFRAPFGRALADQLQPSAESLLEASVEFRRTAEEQGFGAAFQQLGDDFLVPKIDDLLSQDLTNPLQDALGDIRAGGEIGAVTGGIFGGQLGGQLGGALGSTLTAALIPVATPIRTLVGLFQDFVGGLGDIGFPDLSPQDLLGDVGWPNISAAMILNPITWPNIAVSSLLNQFDLPDLSVSNIVDSIGWPEIGAVALLNPITWPSIAASALIDVIDWPDFSGPSIQEQLIDQATQAGTTGGHPQDILSHVLGGGQSVLGGMASGLASAIGAKEPIRVQDISGGSQFGPGGIQAAANAVTPGSHDVEIFDRATAAGTIADIQAGIDPLADDIDLSHIGLQSGGRITQTGTARVHRGELVASPDRLVSDLAAAISQAGGGGDSSRVVSELQRLRDELAGDGDERVVRELRRVREAIRALRDDVNTSTDVTRLGR